MEGSRRSAGSLLYFFRSFDLLFLFLVEKPADFCYGRQTHLRTVCRSKTPRVGKGSSVFCSISGPQENDKCSVSTQRVSFAYRCSSPPSAEPRKTYIEEQNSCLFLSPRRAFCQ